MQISDLAPDFKRLHDALTAGLANAQDTGAYIEVDTIREARSHLVACIESLAAVGFVPCAARPDAPTPPTLFLGQRVRFRHDVERHPDFVVPAGATGVLVQIEEHLLAVRLDEDLCWDNEVQWVSPHDGEYTVKSLLLDCEVLDADAPAPAIPDGALLVTVLNEDGSVHAANIALSDAMPDDDDERRHVAAAIRNGAVVSVGGGAAALFTIRPASILDITPEPTEVAPNRYTWHPTLTGHCYSCHREYRVSVEALATCREADPEGTAGLTDRELMDDWDNCLSCIEGNAIPGEHAVVTPDGHWHIQGLTAYEICAIHDALQVAADADEDRFSEALKKVRVVLDATIAAGHSPPLD